MCRWNGSHVSGEGEFCFAPPFLHCAGTIAEELRLAHDSLERFLREDSSLNQTRGPERRFPWDYFALTFGFSWLVWLPAILGSAGIIPFPAERYSGTLSLLGLFGPMFGACTLTYRADGWAGLSRLFGGLFRVRFRWVWWGAIILVPLGHPGSGALSPLLTGIQSPPQGTSSIWMFLSTFVMVTLIGGGQEEFGWRGYVLDRIQSRYSALVSSLIVGAFWAAWHAPLWFMPGTSLRFTPFGPFVVGLLGLSVILTWVYNNTGKSVLVPMLTHGMTNAVHAVFPVFIVPGSDQPVYTYWAVLCAIVAIGIAVIWGPATLSGRNPDPSIPRALEGVS